MRGVVAIAVWLVASLALLGLDVPHARLFVMVGAYGVLLPVLVRVVARDGSGAAPVVSRRAFVVLAVVIGVATLVIAHWWDRGILWGDEDCYRQQARIFESGHPWLAAPAPTSPDAATSQHELRFLHHIIHDGHWFTKYPPVWPAVLALGDALGVRWLVNPLLAVLALWIIYRLARLLALRDPKLPLVMLIASPFFFMTAACQMSHMLGLVCCAGATLCFASAMRSGRVLAFAGAIALLCLCAFVRPFTAFCAGIALVPFAIPATATRRAAPFVAVAAGLGAITVAAMALYNHFYTGHYGQSLYALYADGKLKELSLSSIVIVDNLKNAARWSLQDTALFTWPLAFALAIYALIADRERRYEHSLVLVVFVALGVGNLIHTEGSSSRFGDRYLFEGIAGPMLLAARGIELLAERWRVRNLGALVAVLTIGGVLLAVPLVRPTLREIRPYVHVHDVVDALPDDGSLVFFTVTDAFTGDRFDLNATDYTHAPHMFLVDPGPARRAQVAAAEHRARWIVLGYDEQAGAPVVLARGLSAAPSAP